MSDVLLLFGPVLDEATSLKMVKIMKLSEKATIREIVSEQLAS